MTQREPSVSADSLVDNCGGTHVPQQGMHLPVFPSVELGHREPASPCWCSSPSTSGQCPVSSVQAAPGEHGHGASLSVPRGQGLCSAHTRHPGPSPVPGSWQACQDGAKAEAGQAGLGSTSLGSVLAPTLPSGLTFEQVTSEFI